MPRVSVIIPTYNRAHLIEETLESALAQTYPDYEIIVVDDGSTDGTLSVLSKYEDRLRVVSQAHQGNGGAQARNLGISKASGEYVAFLDSDDVWFPAKLERQLELIQEKRALSWAYTNAEVFDDATGRMAHVYDRVYRMHQGDVLPYLLFENFIPFSSTLARTSLLAEVGGCYPIAKGTDWDLNLRLASRTSIGYVSEALTRIRIHRGRIAANVSLAEALEARKAIVERAVERERKRLLPLRNKALAHMYVKTGHEYAVAGEIAQARRLFLQALRYSPSAWEAYLSLLGCLGGERAFKAVRAAVRWRWHRKSRSSQG